MRLITTHAQDQFNLLSQRASRMGYALKKVRGPNCMQMQITLRGNSQILWEGTSPIWASKFLDRKAKESQG